MRILIADDHEIVRQGLRGLLEAHPGWQVCAEARTGREAVEMARQLKPDLAVLDFGMPELNGLEATRQIRESLPDTEVLILTMHESEQIMRAVLAAGARGYVLKNDAGTVLVSAVEQLLRHKPFFTPKVTEMILEGYLDPTASTGEAAASSDRLTPREREIVQLLAEGKSNKEVAAVLGISVHTAETHRNNIMHKLKLRSMSELVRYAIREHIIQP